jgi:phosphatidylglycerophosphatase A
LGFALFRGFDILKPWPVSLVDRRVGGGLGIMADDVVAAIYAMTCLEIIEYLSLSYKIIP